METKNELAIITESAGLETTQAQTLLDSFSNLFKEAKGWEDKAKTINVTDISQTEQMKQAREARIALKGIRVNAENKRKELKEKSLREGKAIDGIANVIKALVVPIEEHLEKQEKFAETVEAERKMKMVKDRILKLSEYVQDVTFYNLKEMSDESFEKLLANAKKAVEDKKLADKKVEEDRIARIKAEAEEQARIKAENEKLRKEADEKEKIRLAEKAESDIKLAEANAKVEAERIAKEKSDKALRDKEEAERKAQEAKIKAEKDEVERIAKASDEEKLEILFGQFANNVVLPKCESEHARAIVSKVGALYIQIIQVLKK